MKKLLLVSLCFLMLCITQVFAQNRTVTGTVTAKEDGLPIPGVTVKVKGTNVGTQTNTAGKYTLSVPQGATLTFSFIGYEQLSVPVTGPTVSPQLVLSSKQLGEVVVTGALGVKRASKEIGYSTVQVSSAQLNQTNETSVLVGLSGKVAGLQVNMEDNSINPSFRFVLRGNRSLNGNNQALVVVDGLPIPTSDLAYLNPEDFESASVLEGASAAALYGSEGSNGAIVITTKRGTGNKAIITYSNSLQATKAAYIPWTQYSYGQYGGEGSPYTNPVTGASLYVPYENQQYGPAFDGSTVQLGAPAYAGGPINTAVYSRLPGDQRLNFFQTGITEQNQVTFSQGDGNNGVYFSAQNVYTTGIVPDDRNIRDAIAVNGDKTYGIFKIDFKVNYSKINISTYGNDYGSVGGGSLYGDLQQWPANLDIQKFRDVTSTFNTPSNFYDAYAANPWWQIEDTRQKISRDVFSGNLNLSLTPTKWLDLNYKLAENFGVYQLQSTAQEVDFSAYSISDPLGAGNIPSTYPSGKRLGQVTNQINYGDGSNQGNTTIPQGNNGYARVQNDFNVNLHHTFFNDFKSSLLLGASVWQESLNDIYNTSTNLIVPNYYNINTISGVPTTTQENATIHQLGLYGDFHVGYKDFAFLDATGRNDWDSRLPSKNRSIFFPSVSGSVIITDAVPALKNNSILSYLKLRAAVSQVGQVSIAPYSIANTYSVANGFPYGSLGGLNLGTTNYSANLKPEQVDEVEFGADFSLFNGRIDGSVSHYDTHSKNQTISVGVGPETGFTNEVINAGNLQSMGWEFSLKGDIFTQAQNKFGWNVGGNFQIQDSKVISLAQGQSQFNISGGAGNEFAIVGQPYPVIKTSDFERDPSGKVIVSATSGYPIANPNQVVLGRTTPKYLLGVNTTLSYKFVSLYVLAEYRGGYVIYNAVGRDLNFAGISGLSASAGRQDFVYPNSVIQTGANTFVPNTNISVANGNYGFWQQSAYNTTNSPLVSSAAFWRLDEAALNFNLNKFVKNSKYMKGLSVGFTGRNLFLLKPKNAWTDPEFSNDNSNAVGYATSNQLPGARIFGGNVKVTF